MRTRIGDVFADMRLRTLMTLLVLLLLIFFGVAQGVFLGTINRNAYSAKQAYVQNRADQMRVQTDLLVSNITSSANALAYNDLVLKYTQTINIREALNVYNRIDLLLEAVTMANPNIEGIILTDFDTVHFGNTEGAIFTLKRRLAQELDACGWPAAQANLSLEDGNTQTLVCVTPSYERRQRRLYVVIFYNLNSFEAMLNLSNTEEEGYFLIDNGDRILYAGGALGDGRRAMLKRVALEHAREEALICGVSSATALKWRWAICEPAINVSAQNQGMVRFTLLMDVLLVVLLLMFLLLHDQSVNRPITRMVEFLDESCGGQGKARLNMLSRNEIGRIAQAINRMLDGMERVNEEAWHARQSVYALKIAQQQTQLNALQSQINPHFLYNTLECVRGIAMVHGVNEILDISTYMADIFRYSIKGGEYVRLEQEMEIVREYIGIMQIRQNNRYQVHIDMPQEVLSARIPRMILQPIVENAVFHGLERVCHTPCLSIEGALKGGHLELTVSDNGVGMKREELEALRRALRSTQRDGAPELASRKGIGLVNISDRIRLTCGVGYGLCINSQTDFGTTVLITLPHVHINEAE